MKKIFAALLTFKSLIAIVLGMLTTLSFAPYHFSPLAILCPALLLFLLQDSSKKRAFGIGWCYGFGLFITGTWWIYLSVHNFGHLPPILAMITTILLAGYLALFYGLTGLLVCWLSNSGTWVRSLLVFPAAWVLLAEWTRSSLFTGFHWLILGYAMIDTPLGGFAPIIGVYGISLLTLITAGILYQACTQHIRTLWLLILLVAVIWLNGEIFKLYEFTHINGKKLNVAMIQGNVPQEYKWRPEESKNIIQLYDQLTQKQWDADLILWPEAAIPMLNTDAAPYLQQLETEAKQRNRTVLLGIPIKSDNQYYNGLLLLGKDQGRYYKRHLVPFGEYTPFKGLLDPMLLALQIPMSAFTPGPEKQPLLKVNDVHIAPFICYEIVEPDEVRRNIQDAEMMLTITDDSWFDGSIASEQHLQMARMRARENALPHAVLSSRGASAIIAANGQIVDYLGEHKVGTLRHTLRTVTGTTPWRYLGSTPTLVFCLLALIISTIIRLRTKKSP